MRVALSFASAAALVTSPAVAADLVVGQTFTCAGPGAVVAVVGKLDPDGKDGAVIASISLFVTEPDSVLPEAGHIPIDAQVFKASCPTAAAPRALSEGFGGGYAQWRAAFDAHKGGYFTIPVSEILQMIAQTIPSRGEAQ